MAGINHDRVVASKDKGLFSDWNADHKQKGNHDCEQHQFLNNVIENRTDFPAGPVVGQQIYRTDYPNGLIFDGTSWKSMTPAFLIVVAADGSGDYLTIQEGIDALPASGGIVHVKTGQYLITAPITINVDNTTLEGDIYGTIIYTNTLDISLIDVNGVSRIVIRNLLIYGGGAGKNNAGIEWVSSFDGRIEGNYISNCEAMGIYVEGTETLTTSGNYIYSCWNWGIMMLDSDINVIINNFIYNIDEDTTGIGIEINDSDSNIINNNNIELCENEGVYFYAALKNNFEGNMVKNNSHNNNNLFSGIILDGTSVHNSIIGNKSICDKLAKNQKWGIREANVADNWNLVTNNVCVDNVTAEISTQGPNTITANNITGP